MELVYAFQSPTELVLGTVSCVVFPILFLPDGCDWFEFFLVSFFLLKKKLFVDSRSSRRLVLNIYLYEENRFDLAMAPMKMVL